MPLPVEGSVFLVVAAATQLLANLPCHIYSQAFRDFRNNPAATRHNAASAGNNVYTLPLTGSAKCRFYFVSVYVDQAEFLYQHQAEGIG
jgi:hypothetical protein